MQYNLVKPTELTERSFSAACF